MTKGSNRSRKPRIGIVTTMRAPGPSFPLWVHWHRAIGFDRIYVYVDADGGDAAQEALSVSAKKHVEFIRVSPRLQAQMKRDTFCAPFMPLTGDWSKPIASPEELTTRQLCNTRMAIDRARLDGVGWLLHIDVDELFLPPDNDASNHFKMLSDLGMGYIIYDNHEAAPEHEPCTSPFTEVTLFKKAERLLDDRAVAAVRRRFDPKAGYFLAYANGKAAVRTVEGATPAGVHGFNLPPAAGLGRCRVSTPAILHYPYTGFDSYWRKFKRLGNWQSETMLGQKWWPPHFEMTSRDLAVAGDERRARAFYKRVAVYASAARREELLRAGVLMRISEPRRLLTAAGW